MHCGLQRGHERRLFRRIRQRAVTIGQLAGSASSGGLE